MYESTKNLADMDATVKHLNDVTSYSKANTERQVQNLQTAMLLMSSQKKYATFPIRIDTKRKERRLLWPQGRIGTV